MTRKRPAIVVATALIAACAGVPVLVNAASASQSATNPATSTTADPEVKRSGTGSYIVQLDDSPVAEYAGGIAGLAATKVVPGGKLLKTAAPVVDYVKHLAGERDQVIAKVPGVKKLYDYSYTYAGFSAEMSYDDAVKLAKSSGVKSVEPNEIEHADTVDTPRFLGLSGKGGAWQQAGGIDKAGDGVIIGMIDSGYVPERASFAPMKTTQAVRRDRREEVEGHLPGRRGGARHLQQQGDRRPVLRQGHRHPPDPRTSSSSPA